MSKIYQELYCGSCQTYFVLGLSDYLDGYEANIICPACKYGHRRYISKGQVVGYEVNIVCPACNHEHRRHISKGQVVEAGFEVNIVCPSCKHEHCMHISKVEVGRHQNPPKEEIISTKLSCHKVPIHVRMDAAHRKGYGGRRDGEVLKSAKDIVPETEAKTTDHLREFWIKRFGGCND